MTTKASYFTAIAKVAELINETLKFANANTKNVVGMIDTVRSNYDGDYIQDVETGLSSFI